MLKSKGRLLNCACDMVDSNYTFKKGKSRSKRYLNLDSAPSPKRKKEVRNKRMKELEVKKKLLNQKIDYKERRCEISDGSRSYKLCEEITEEVEALQKEGFIIDAELVELQQKDKSQSGTKKRDWFLYLPQKHQ